MRNRFRHPLILLTLLAVVSPTAAEGPSYEAIDRHALNTPLKEEQSTAALARYLTKPARNDREKVRAIFRWMTDRIAYDVEGYVSGNYGDLSAAGVLRRYKAVCEGYANLFEELCREANVEAVKIRGYAKGVGYTQGQNFARTNHSWNAVKLDGKWHLLDVTWGAGSYDGKKFVRQFKEFYFLPPPDQFVFSHLPKDPSWQLLEQPLSQKEFERLPRINYLFFQYRVSGAAIRRKVREKDFRGLVNVFPCKGKITLREVPLDRFLRAGTSYAFRVEVEGVSDVALINGPKWFHLTRKDKVFEGTFTPDKGPLKCSAQLPGGKTFWTVLQYVVK